MPPLSISPITIDGQIVTIVGWAHGLAFIHGAATWKIAVFDSQDPASPCSVGLRSSLASVLGQLRWMREGEAIRVMAALPEQIPAGAAMVAKGTTDCGVVVTYDWRLDSPDVELNVIQLKLMGRTVFEVQP